MSNTFVNVEDVVRDSAILLGDELLMGNLIQRNLMENKFATKVGDTVKVKTIPDLGDANLFTSTTSATNITETYRDVVLEKHMYKQVTLSSKERTMNLDDFMQVVGIPCMQSVKQSIEEYLLLKAAAGFARNLTGTMTSDPTTLAHLVTAEAAILNAGGKLNNLAGIVSPTAWASLIQLAQFASADYGPERPSSFREGTLGRALGADWFRSGKVTTITRGDIAGTVLIDGDPGTTNTIHVDALTAETGTIYEGTRFTVADDSSSNVYTVMKDATIANHECDLEVYPAADAAVADGKLVTFQSALKSNIVFNRLAMAGAIVAPAPFTQGQSAVVTQDGFSLRASFWSAPGSMADYYMVDAYVGARVIQPTCGAVIGGT